MQVQVMFCFYYIKIVFSLHAYSEVTFFSFLFSVQAGPLIKVKIPKDNDGKSKQFAFVNFKHEVSVPYALNMLSGIRFFGRPLNIQFRAGMILYYIILCQASHKPNNKCCPFVSLLLSHCPSFENTSSFKQTHTQIYYDGGKHAGEIYCHAIVQRMYKNV